MAPLVTGAPAGGARSDTELAGSPVASRAGALAGDGSTAGSALTRTAAGSRVPAVGALVVVVLTVSAGFLLARLALPIVHGRSFLWITGRALGLAAYTAMVLLVVLGTWMRHPSRRRWPGPHPETQLRLHAMLGMATVVLLAGHIGTLAADRYAGVGWSGAVLPGVASYRPWAVAAGVVAAYGLVAVVATAALGGRLVGQHWLTVHRVTVPVFALVWFHAVLAGTDAPRLRVVYALSGVLVVGITLSRVFARPAVVGGGSSGSRRRWMRQ